MKKGLEKKIVDAALKLAVSDGWAQISLSQIAAKAKAPLADIYQSLPSKAAILEAYSRQIDLRMLEACDDVDTEDSARDRLFDVIMNRFDAMAGDKEALHAIQKDLRRQPFEILAMRDGILQSLRWMLEAAHLDAGGLRGALRQRGLAVIYADVFNIWLKDDDPGLAKTMAHLDRRLRRVEDLLRRFQSTTSDFSKPGQTDPLSETQPTLH